MSEQIKEEKKVIEAVRTEESGNVEDGQIIEGIHDTEAMPETAVQEKRYPSYKERKRLKEEERRKKKEEEDKLLTEIAMAQAELDALKKEQGLIEEKGVKKLITNFFDKRENKEKVAVNKKTYLILSILLGWMGAHRFYSKQYGLGLLYLATCWTGFPVSLVVIDVLIVIPMKPDENGKIYLQDKGFCAAEKILCENLDNLIGENWNLTEKSKKVT